MSWILSVRAGVVLVCVLAIPAVPAEECGKTFSEVFREVSPSVVQVYSVAIDPFSVVHRVQHGVGTGFLVDGDGHVVTNAHIVHGTSQIMLSTGDEALFPAELVGSDPISDLAVIRPAGPAPDLPFAAFGDSDGLAVGEEVLAIGFPFGIGKTATRGIVSGTGRVMPFSTFSWMTPYLQTDAAISPGNSGGPLVDRCGRVVAVNTLGSVAGQNVNFSIPINLVRELLPELIETGRVVRAWHGINGRIVPFQFVFAFGIHPGYIVETIEPGSPAEEIGLKGGNFPVVIGNDEFLLGGDVITEVNGVELDDMETVYRIARSLEVGDRIRLKYYRDGEPKTAEVVLPERPVLPGDTRRFRENRHQQ